MSLEFVLTVQCVRPVRAAACWQCPAAADGGTPVPARGCGKGVGARSGGVASATWPPRPRRDGAPSWGRRPTVRRTGRAVGVAASERRLVPAVRPVPRPLVAAVAHRGGCFPARVVG